MIFYECLEIRLSLCRKVTASLSLSLNQPFPTDGWRLPAFPCDLYPGLDVRPLWLAPSSSLYLPRRGCGICKLLTSTTTQANTNTTIFWLPRFDSPSQLADQWMDANPNEHKQQQGECTDPPRCRSNINTGQTHLYHFHF